MKPLAVVAIWLACLLPLIAQDTAPKPPVAPTKPYELDFHSQKIDDPYFWLKDKKNPETIRYIEAENAYREAITKHLKPFEEKLYKEILSHIKQTDLDVPARNNGFWYYTRTLEGKQYPIYCRKKDILDAAEEVLLDVNQLAEGRKFMSANPVGVSDDTRFYAFETDTTGFREYYLSIKDLASGKLLEDTFVKITESGFQWANDNRTIFYVTEDAAKRPHKLYRHVIGEPKEKDVLVYEEKDELYRLGISRTHDKKFLVQTSAGLVTTECRVVAADRPADEFQMIQQRQEGVEYDIDHRDGFFYIRHNGLGRTNFCIQTVPVADFATGHRTDFIPYAPTVFIEGILLFRDFAVLSERESGLPQLRIYDFVTKASHRISIPEAAYDVSLGANPEYDSKTVRMSYTSFVTPNSVYDYNPATRERTLRKRTEVPGGFDPANHTSERIQATATDGVRVPMSLVYRKGLIKDGKAPIFLYGYGSYGVAIPVAFDPTLLALLDRGVVCAVAHVRGGSDLGRQWYLDGKLMKKRNTFTDFIACADHLVAAKYGARDRLAIDGASAGGLLIGATINLRPDVCKVAVLEMPFVDVINTMLDESLPLTAQDFKEVGNPKVPDEGRYMLGYSPYDNLAKKDYPSIMVTTSLNDSQVLFHEPTKYVAKLRSLKTDKNPLILKCNMEAGHAGASGRYDNLKEQAAVYAFVLDQLGITN
ncbi:MAG TPA: S9 family peptidase [Gemmataceae bacterium]|nr:S9 family peptidase [Gemmataceae bacterium]